MTSSIQASPKKPALAPKAPQKGTAVGNDNRRMARGTAATINTIKDQGYHLVSFDGKEAVFRRPRTKAFAVAGGLLALAGIYLACSGLGAHLLGIALLFAGFYQGGKPAEVFSIDFETPRAANQDL